MNNNASSPPLGRLMQKHAIEVWLGINSQHKEGDVKMKAGRLQQKKHRRKTEGILQLLVRHWVVNARNLADPKVHQKGKSI